MRVGEERHRLPDRCELAGITSASCLEQLRRAPAGPGLRPGLCQQAAGPVEAPGSSVCAWERVTGTGDGNRTRTISLGMIVAAGSDLPSRRSARAPTSPRVTVSPRKRLPNRARSGHAHGSVIRVIRPPIGGEPLSKLRGSVSPTRGRVPSSISVANSNLSSQERGLAIQTRRVCHASLLPGRMLRGLRGCPPLACVVSRSFAVLYGQNQASARLTALEAVDRQRRCPRSRWKRLLGPRVVHEPSARSLDSLRPEARAALMLGKRKVGSQ